MKVGKITAGVLTVLVLMVIVAGCGPKYAETGTVIISGKEALKLIGTPGTVLVDAQKATSYAKEHIEGAVNIARDDIVVTRQVVNMLAPPEVIEQVMGGRGIGNDTLVIVYDDTDNMDAARLWWTLLVYGHANVKVVSGGLQELKRQGATVTTTVPPVRQASFKAGPADSSMMIEADEILRQVNMPDKNTVLVDTRTLDEFNSGTIPGSILIDYVRNNNSDGKFKSILNTKLLYKDNGIEPQNTIILYCRTSIRGAQSFLALYNAGYRNLKLYDGAWLDWELDPSRPVQMPQTEKVQVTFQDMS